MSKSLKGSSSSQLCRQNHVCDGVTLLGEECLSSPSSHLCQCSDHSWHWGRAELCFLESKLSITLAA